MGASNFGNQFGSPSPAAGGGGGGSGAALVERDVTVGASGEQATVQAAFAAGFRSMRLIENVTEVLGFTVTADFRLYIPPGVVWDMGDQQITLNGGIPDVINDGTMRYGRSVGGTDNFLGTGTETLRIRSLFSRGRLEDTGSQLDCLLADEDISVEYKSFDWILRAANKGLHTRGNCFAFDVTFEGNNSNAALARLNASTGTCRVVSCKVRGTYQGNGAVEDELAAGNEHSYIDLTMDTAALCFPIGGVITGLRFSTTAGGNNPIIEDAQLSNCFFNGRTLRCDGPNIQFDNVDSAGINPNSQDNITVDNFHMTGLLTISGNEGTYRGVHMNGGFGISITGDRNLVSGCFVHAAAATITCQATSDNNNVYGNNVKAAVVDLGTNNDIATANKVVP